MLTKVTFYENIRKPFPLYSGIILEHIIIHIMADVGKHYTFQGQFKTHLQFNAFGILSFYAGEHKTQQHNQGYLIQKLNGTY